MTTIDAIRDDFAFLDSWEDRYRYIIDLGRALPAMPDALKTEETKVRGCSSQVWFVPKPSQGTPLTLEFLADSDAHIVKGLIAILLAIYSSKTPRDILATDSRAILAELGLDKHLSPTRTNGLFAMVENIERLAEHHAAAEPTVTQL